MAFALDMAWNGAVVALLLDRTTSCGPAVLLDVSSLATVVALLDGCVASIVDLELVLRASVSTCGRQMNGVFLNELVEVHGTFRLVLVVVHIVGNHCYDSFGLAAEGLLDEDHDEILELRLSLIEGRDPLHGFDDIGLRIT